MGRTRAAGFTLLILALALASCGSDSLLLSMRRAGSDIEIHGLVDGQVIAAGSPVTLQLSSRSVVEQKDLEMTVSLSSPNGPATGAAPQGSKAADAQAAAWKDQRITAPALNEDIPLALPDLAPGQYQVEVAVLSGGEQVARKAWTFFVVRDRWAIAGINSFPPVITTGAAVLLRADLAVPGGVDPYLRWTWKGTVIARGMASTGTSEALWTAPSEEGVYSIHLELFPAAPAGAVDFAFSSSIIQSTDLYVTAGERLGKGDLWPGQSYHTLLHMQGNLRDYGAAAAKPPKAEPSAIGSPQVVQVADGFGYRFDGKSGVAIPWLALPVVDGALAPFTITVSLTPESFDAEQSLLSLTAAEGALSLVLSLHPEDRTPAAVLAPAGQPALPIPWKGPGLQKGVRATVSLSVVPRAGGIDAAWFLDGAQVSRLSAETVIGELKAGGKTVLAGDKGFVGTVDELGVYARDGKGRPSTDPDLFGRAARAALGDAVVLAEGFDGPWLPEGFAAAGGAVVEGGSLLVPAGGSVDLPPLPVPADDVVYGIELSLTSAQAGLLALSWEGSSSPVLETPLAADAGKLSFTVAAGALSLAVTSPGGRARTVKIPSAPDEKARLVLRVSGQVEAKQPLSFDSLLAARQR
jgi:hypothetical protein